MNSEQFYARIVAFDKLTPAADGWAVGKLPVNPRAIEELMLIKDEIIEADAFFCPWDGGISIEFDINGGDYSIGLDDDGRMWLCDLDDFNKDWNFPEFNKEIASSFLKGVMPNV